uniref:microtubule-severing ATPase n=1 Tax=Ascaris lumbricoides TaxID=6252 RepID=A0A9J2PLK8_ASCLU
MAPRLSPSKSYDSFNSAYRKSKEIVFSAVLMDEQSDNCDEAKKREIMELYRSGIKQFEAALRFAKQIMPSEKVDEVERHRVAIEKNLRSTKGRLSDLEKMFPPVSKGRTAVARVQPNQKPTVAVAPSSNVPRAGRIAGRGAGSADRARGPTIGRTKMSRADLLKGVDDKFGGPLLDEILDMNGVQMSDVEGAESAKKALEEAVILPALNPSLFSGLRQPVQGILLFGPPGNGKTMLARAVATECGSTVFLNISAATLTSKWVGDAEKIVKALFQIARNGQPSIIFIDEIDSILCERNDKETEVSRRMKTEFLIQMDGICSSKTDRLLVIGATNRPEELDTAVLRRFPKRILVDVPDEKARANLVATLLKKHKTASDLTSYQLRELAAKTEGYSNSDIVALCREAAMVPIREMSRRQLKQATEAQLRPIQMSDFETALSAIKPSTNQQMRLKLRHFAEISGQVF